MASNKIRNHPSVRRGADGIQVKLDALRIDPGWNVRERTEELEAHIDSIARSIAGGTRVPALEVYVDGEGNITIVDGHCRREGYIRARDVYGAEADYVDVREFQGNDADRIAYMFTSAQGKTLTQYEQSIAFKRLKALNWSTADIAKRTGRSEAFVASMLVLANADSDVQELVRSGDVSPSAAVTVVRKKGGAAGKELKAKLDKARVANPKARITDKDVGMNRVTPETMNMIRSFFGSLRTSLGHEVYDELVQSANKPLAELDGVKVTFPIANLLPLYTIQQALEGDAK